MLPVRVERIRPTPETAPFRVPEQATSRQDSLTAAYSPIWTDKLRAVWNSSGAHSDPVGFT
ncbi:hypothetical protein [Paenibacillus dendritiformis]|uniref:hypothetical protein n=1 Tax=Paenibacillus dendritiformis TaxID=130049 RepID=UPI00387E1BDE